MTLRAKPLAILWVLFVISLYLVDSRKDVRGLSQTQGTLVRTSGVIISHHCIHHKYNPLIILADLH